VVKCLELSWSRGTRDQASKGKTKTETETVVVETVVVKTDTETETVVVKTKTETETVVVKTETKTKTETETVVVKTETKTKTVSRLSRLLITAYTNLHLMQCLKFIVGTVQSMKWQHEVVINYQQLVTNTLQQVIVHVLC